MKKVFKFSIIMLLILFSCSVISRAQNAKTGATITKNPVSDSICRGVNASFTVAASGGTFTYHWQEDQGYGFYNIYSSSLYSGFLTDSLIVLSCPASYSGYKYRCEVTNISPSQVLMSAEATLTVYNLVVTQPSYAALCINTTPFALSGGAPAGGIYSGSGVNGGIFNPALAGYGTHTIKYIYTDTNACTDSAKTSIKVQLLISPPVVSDTMRCGSGIFDLKALSPYAVCQWWDAPVGGTLLATDSIFTTPVLDSTAIYYIQAVAVNKVGGTNFGGGDNGTSEMFDLYAHNTITIDSFDVHALTWNGNQNYMYVYYKHGSYVGNETNPSAWTLLGHVRQFGAGAGVPTKVHVGGLTIQAGDTCAIYIYYDYGRTNLNSSTTVSNNDFTLSLGRECYGQFGMCFNNAIWNGKIYYHTPESNCPSNRLALQAMVHQLPAAHIAGDTSICEGAATDLAFLLGGSPPWSFSWTDGTNVFTQSWLYTPSFNVSVIPGDTTLYYITAFADSLCPGTFTDTSQINVVPIPVVAFSGLDTAYCIDHALVSLSGNPVGGSFSGDGISNNNFDPAGAGAGTHTIVYRFSGINGCENADTVITTVHLLPLVSFSGLDSFYCISANAIVLNGLPAGGTFSGTGILSNVFDPGTAGTGVFNITYMYTDEHGCQNFDTDTVEVSNCAGISETGNNSTILIYPNPSHGSFTAALNSGGFSFVNIYNTMGQLVKHVPVLNGQNVIDMNDSPPGVYYLNAEGTTAMPCIKLSVIK